MELKIKEPIDIVFVDDETYALTLVQHTLKEEIKSGQINLLTFSSGEECLAYLRKHSVDMMLVFSDINMPNMDGFKLLNEIKSIHPRIDLFFVTAYDMDDYKVKADCLGAKGFLTKPMNFKAIKTIINDYI